MNNGDRIRSLRNHGVFMNVQSSVKGSYRIVFFDIKAGTFLFSYRSRYSRYKATRTAYEGYKKILWSLCDE